MKTLLIGLLSISTMTAQASMLEVNGPLDQSFLEAQVSNEATHFATLGNLFKVGVRPSLTKISNIAWAGRCFLNDKQNEPTNSGYIFRQKRTSDAGPIGATSKSYEAFSYWETQKAPNYFDSMNIEQVFLVLPSIKARDARIKADSIEIDIDTSSKAKSNLKISGEYLVEEITESESDTGPIGKGVVTIRCYYFIPKLNH